MSSQSEFLRNSSRNPNTQLSQRGLQIARTGWGLLAIVALGFLLTSLPGYFPKIGSGLPSHGIDINPSTVDSVFQSLGSVASLLSAVISLALAGLLFRHSFENPAVAAISFYLLMYGIIMSGVLEVWGIHWVGTSDFVITIQGMLMATPTVALLVLFPNGKFVPGWTRWLLLISIPWNFIGFLLPTLNSFEENFLTISLLLVAWLLLPGLGIYAQIYRYRKVSTPDERQQTKWVLFGFTLWTVYIVISTYPYFYLTSLPPGTSMPWWASISTLGWWFSTAILPVTMTIAVTRSRLWNIDVVINRTLVYGALTAATMAFYVLVVGALGNVLQAGNSTFIAFLTTGLVAILFQPLRERLQRGVNRLMYGERDNPVAVLSKLGEELEHTGSPEDALAGITETVAQTLKLPYVAIELGENNEIAASFGIPKPEVLRIPMSYQAETSGYLLVAPRSPGENFNASENQLLENIAQQAGAAAHAAKLTADLRLSRQRLVTAREEERRRIRRDLHDGLGPQLASQTLTLTAARRMLQQDPQAADDLLKEAIKHAQAATDDVRRVVYELRPPALDDLGLIGAIQAYAHKLEAGGLEIDLDIPVKLPTLPAAAEVACYLIIQEALTNVMRHSGSNECRILITTNGNLHIEIKDEGRGISPEHRRGVGLRSMRQRAEELGGSFEVKSPIQGGTQVVIDLPLQMDED
jgi:signal transduction histidine kinase